MVVAFYISVTCYILLKLNIRMMFRRSTFDFGILTFKDDSAIVQGLDI